MNISKIQKFGELCKKAEEKMRQFSLSLDNLNKVQTRNKKIVIRPYGKEILDEIKIKADEICNLINTLYGEYLYVKEHIEKKQENLTIALRWISFVNEPYNRFLNYIKESVPKINTYHKKREERWDHISSRDNFDKKMLKKIDGFLFLKINLEQVDKQRPVSVEIEKPKGFGRAITIRVQKSIKELSSADFYYDLLKLYLRLKREIYIAMLEFTEYRPVHRGFLSGLFEKRQGLAKLLKEKELPEVKLKPNFNYYKKNLDEIIAMFKSFIDIIAKIYMIARKARLNKNFQDIKEFKEINYYWVKFLEDYKYFSEVILMHRLQGEIKQFNEARKEKLLGSDLESIESGRKVDKDLDKKYYLKIRELERMVSAGYFIELAPIINLGKGMDVKEAEYNKYKGASNLLNIVQLRSAFDYTRLIKVIVIDLPDFEQLYRFKLPLKEPAGIAREYKKAA